jgi:hypothetical protein
LLPDLTRAHSQGHAHVEVLRRWGGSPVQGVRVTLVTNALQAPYS